VLPVIIFAVYFVLMAGLIGYVCWTGRPRGVPDAEPSEVPVLEPDPGEDGQQAA
jgi:hypothetical protein